MSPEQIAEREKQQEEYLEESLMPLARAGPATPAHRQPSLAANTVLDRPFASEAAVLPVGNKFVLLLQNTERRWGEFRQEMEASPARVTILNDGMTSGYPAWQERVE